MTLLEQFVSETREALHSISAMLMALESRPDDTDLMTGLFRVVHTLKGNSGLFDYPEMSKVLHAAEDVMAQVRQGELGYSTALADGLLDTMDFVGRLCDAIELGVQFDASCIADAGMLAARLRALIGVRHDDADAADAAAPAALCAPPAGPSAEALYAIAPALRMDAYRHAVDAGPARPLHWLTYLPDEQCFFQGDDPFYQARNTPELLWGGIAAIAPWPALQDLDAYRCALQFTILSAAPRAELEQYYRYSAEQVRLVPLSPLDLVLPQGDASARTQARLFMLDALDLVHEGALDTLADRARALDGLAGAGKTGRSTWRCSSTATPASMRLSRSSSRASSMKPNRLPCT